MNTSNLLYASIMLLSGLLIPVMAALNASAGAKIGNPYVAGMGMVMVAAAGAGLVVIGMRLFEGAEFRLDWQALETPWVFAAGLVMAFYMLSITALAPRLGIGTAVFFVLLGQIIAAAMIDHWGLFGAAKSPITWMRGLGIVLMGLGVFLARKI